MLICVIMLYDIYIYILCNTFILFAQYQRHTKSYINIYYKQSVYLNIKSVQHFVSAILKFLSISIIMTM